MLARIPDLTDAEFGALLFLFHAGLKAHPDLCVNSSVMGALHTLEAVERVTVKLPGE